MDNNSLTLFFYNQTKLFFKHLERTKEKQSNKNIHRLRLSIKTIKSILNILESDSSIQIDTQSVLDHILPLFKNAGFLREHKINLKQADKFGLSDNRELLQFFQQKTEHAENELNSELLNLNENEFRKCCHLMQKAISKPDFNSLAETILKGFNERLEQIKRLSEASDENIKLHKIRRCLKDIDFALKWLINSHIFMPGILKENIHSLGRIIGRWHDISVFMTELKAFSVSYPTIHIDTKPVQQAELKLSTHIVNTLKHIKLFSEHLDTKSIYLWFETRKEYREWLTINHDQCDGFRMVFYKKHTGITTISYDDAVEESLCFGWIDSLVRRIDENLFTRKFTPRKPRSVWSPTNIQRIEKLLQKGLVEEPGLKTLLISTKTGKPDWKKVSVQKMNKKVPEIPDHVQNRFMQNEPAWTNFSSLADSYKRQYILWITAAKTEVTRNKRIEKSVLLLKENKKLGMV